jgi:hypothetical protein
MRSVPSSSIAHGHPGDVVHVVLDHFGPLGQAYRGADPDAAEEETIIGNLLTGRYSRPQRVVAFSLADDWAHDVTTKIAFKVLQRALTQGLTLPASTRAMVERAIDTEVRVPARSTPLVRCGAAGR